MSEKTGNARRRFLQSMELGLSHKPTWILICHGCII
jgi:hypothetical protein